MAEVDLTDAPNLRAALHQNGYRVTEPLPRGRFTGLEDDFPATLPADVDGTGDELPDAVEGDGEEGRPGPPHAPEGVTMAESLTVAAVAPEAAPGGSVRVWAEPAPFGCEMFLPIVDPARTARNAAFLAATARRLGMKGI